MLTFEEILEQYKNTIPVPVVHIAKQLGIDIYETEDFTKDQTGSITKEGEKYVIYVNAHTSPRRKRFTIAHEIVHFLKHREKIDERELVTETKQPVYNGLQSQRGIVSPEQAAESEEQSIEEEANRLAAELLMPEEAFKKAWEETSSIEEIAERFQVSPQAASIRAERLVGYTMM